MDEYVPAEGYAAMSTTDDDENSTMAFFSGFLTGIFITLVICTLVAFSL